MRKDGGPRPIDRLLFAVVAGSVFIGAALLRRDDKDSVWGDAFQILDGREPGEGYEMFAVRIAAILILSGYVGWVVDRALGALGIRLSGPPAESADYDDQPPAG